MIVVKLKDGLSNRLFQYSIGRILAEELGFYLKVDAIPEFPGTKEQVLGHSFELPTVELTGHTIEFDKIISDKTPRKIVLNGYFQNWRYYRPYREKIRRWLINDETENLHESNEYDLMVHVRRGDYVDFGWALPFEFYKEAIDRFLPVGGQLWICTDDPYDPFLSRFKKWRPRMFLGNAKATILKMAQAKRLVMSRSTYSWWPTFLSSNTQVCCPLPDTGLWSEESAKGGIDLIERDRFYCLPCCGTYRAEGLEKLYQI